ncbi:hypothetical protein [Bacillus safensis]|uniref:hypothetical protein n=1 Tax=Bacillus safensis TaxID=561879 RepID=UPI002E23353A|nr:hypothetical protein [Bacillus safensis]
MFEVFRAFIYIIAFLAFTGANLYGAVITGDRILFGAHYFVIISGFLGYFLITRKTRKRMKELLKNAKSELRGENNVE